MAHGAGDASFAEALCRRALAMRVAAAAGAGSLAVASAQCLLAQVLCDLKRCACQAYTMSGIAIGSQGLQCAIPGEQFSGKTFVSFVCR